ncbi:MAG: chromate transporter [Bacteroidota bacterium]|nr:chromate transporter [Bacteroidota bacterium]
MINSKPPSFREAFFFWLKLGFISFGGPAGQISIMHEFLVEKKKWISESKFLHALNYCMLLPGPEAQQMATYTGWLLHGLRGGIIAGVLFVLPSVFILLGLSILYVLYGELTIIQSMMNGLKPAVVAIVILALFKIGKRSMSTILHYAIALLSFISIFFFDVPFPLIILTAFVIGFIIQKTMPGFFTGKHSAAEKINQEEGFYINSSTHIPHAGFSRIRILKQILVAACLWSFPFVLFRLFADDVPFWDSMSWFFTKAALVTFGGAYAVLPYVAQVSVEKLHWLTQYEMMDGLALGETTPGPLIMVLAFVGFMGGYNLHESSIVAGTMGLLITVWFTFLPSFLFVLIGAPVIERTQHKPAIKDLLGVISAAVVGVILNLTVYLTQVLVFKNGMHLAMEELFHACWIIISLIALSRFRINMILWIVISALAGLGYYLAFS